MSPSQGSLDRLFEQGEDGLAVAVQLGLADAGDAAERLERRRFGPGGFGQGAVLEDDVGRDALLGGAVAAPGAERIEAGLDFRQENVGGAEAGDALAVARVAFA